MKRALIELTYYDTYYLADIIKQALENPEGYTLCDFFGRDRCLNYVVPFPRFSAFHSFIRFVIDNVISEEGDYVKLDHLQDEFSRANTPQALNPDPTKLPVNFAMERLNIGHPSFQVWLQKKGVTFLDARRTDVSDYYDHLRHEGQFDQLLDRATAEAFFLLFQNRGVLLLFNELMAAEVQRTAQEVIEDLKAKVRFARPGVLRRVPIPKWAQRAVYFRDRGFCVLCQQDLTGLVSIGADENYDHVVPLARGGLNDVSNLQLLCLSCNSKKRMRAPITSNHYETWYEIKE